MLRELVFSLFGILGVGCSATSSSAPAAPVDSGPSSYDAGDGGSGASSCGDSNATPDMPCGTLAWTTSATKSRPRNHQLSVLAETASGPFLFVIGGFDTTTTLPNVDRSGLSGDGSLGGWADMPALPIPVGGHMGGIVGSVIVLAGGLTASGTVTDASYSAVVGDDGSLSSWKRQGSVLHPRMHGGAFVSGNTIYVLGGFNPVVMDDVVRATVTPDGAISAWTTAGQLPSKLSHMSVSLVEGYVYLAGGYSLPASHNRPVLKDVYRGHLADDGTLADWTPMPQLPVAICTHASFFYGGYLYVAGGATESTQEKRVWRAPIDSSHALGAWEEVAPLPIAREHVHQLPVFQNHVYSIGGAIDQSLDSTDHIDIGTFR
jgi:hypothetical protein